jgi:hypothetical protein
MRVSSSRDASTHGKKLYFLFAKYPLPPSGGVNPVGQAVVKEAWTPAEVADDGKPLQAMTRKSRDGREESFLPYARQDGRLYHATGKAGLFIMCKLAPQTPDTDEGWVYGTVTPDGKQVTSAGRVASCLECHRQAPHDRLFTNAGN